MAAIAPERLTRIEALLDRQDILDCLTRFSRGMDRFDRELFLSAFHPDATIDAGAFVGGPEPLYAWASALHEQGQSATQHLLLNHRCEIADDGCGGADPMAGTGLRGLADRIEALGGRLDVDSPAGAGTRVSARLPL